MTPRERDISLSIEILNDIEKAVVEDSMKQYPDLDANYVDVLDAQRQRIANAVRIYCAWRAK
jgi:hypothetical protein